MDGTSRKFRSDPWSNATAGVWTGQMGQVGSDPRDGDAWAHCYSCSRPTRMTGTKLCDRCWELQRNLQPGVTAALANAAPELADALEELFLWITAYERGENKEEAAEITIARVERSRAALRKGGRLP